MNIKIPIKMILITAIVLACAQTWAGSVTENAYWSSGDASGQLAATCTFTYPDERPLAIPRTITVDPNTPDGTVLFSWGYGAFWSDIIMNCVSSNISNNATLFQTPTLSFSVKNSSVDSNGFTTSDPGIRLKLWARFNTECSFSGGQKILAANYSGTLCPATGTDNLLYYAHEGTGGAVNYQLLTEQLSDGTKYLPGGTASLSFRAELIKQGTLSVSSASTLTVTPGDTFYAHKTKNQTRIDDMLDGAGIQLVVPACQLKTTNYSIPMGPWAADSIKHLGNPAYGALIPVNLALECRGEVAHVRFRFEDTGSSLSANKNVSLYDSAGGNKIDGLEIEMRYNGSKVDVDNSTLTDTGSHGSFTSISAGFDAVSTAPFQARYVQNSDITLAGAHYTGPVTGKINMYVTYD